MNEMYAMSQSTHIYSVIGLILVLLIMMSFHKVKGDFQKFVKIIKMLMIFHLSLVGFITLTGAVMMATKHLSFTPANLLMIVAMFIILTLEIKRNKSLANAIKFKSMEEDVYKKLGFKFQAIELFLLLFVSVFSRISDAISF